jgi:hypothetical protein
MVEIVETGFLAHLCIAGLIIVICFLSYDTAIHNYAVGFCSGKAMLFVSSNLDKTFSCQDMASGEVHYYLIMSKVGGF